MGKTATTLGNHLPPTQDCDKDLISERSRALIGCVTVGS